MSRVHQLPLHPGLPLLPLLLWAGQASASPPPSSGLSELGRWLHLPPSLNLGPLALPSGVVLAMLAWLLASWLAARSQKRSGLAVESLLWQAAFAGLLGARLAYVLQWWSEYAADGTGPLVLRLVDIRDGGFNLWAGLVAGTAWALWLSKTQAGLRRAIALPIGLAMGILALGQALQALPAAHAPGLPEFKLVNASAQPISLSELQQSKGQPMVINLWASWCPPCRREMPVLAQAQKEHPGIRFIWINQGEQAGTVLRYLGQQPLPPDQVLFDPEHQASAHWRQRGLPSTYFYDAQGQLRGTRMGELSRASLAEHLQALQTP
ncbi:TlpA family protein disulfide reductase [Comamonas composti]|uniref:TlpA family protein disulfide reductase n=1 Tax=Comamonas composti TaxID=408558 RepID=UPI00042021E4|nr:TlpA family protein disulfide reductase [Comamonas composti]